MGRKARDNKNLTGVKFHILPLLVITIITFSVGISFSKYVNYKNNESIYEVSDFYFESDILKDSSKLTMYKYQNGVDQISVDLYNFVDSLRSSEVGIDFEVEITDIDGNQVKNKREEVISKKVDKFENEPNQTKTIQFTDLKAGTYLITAQSTAPFEKKLQAGFTISESNSNIEYSLNDSVGSAIIQLTVTTRAYDGNITIGWPEGVSPDNTDKNFSNINTGFAKGNTIVNFKSNSEYIFQFFKQNPNKKYTKTDFSVGKE